MAEQNVALLSTAVPTDLQVGKPGSEEANAFGALQCNGISTEHARPSKRVSFAEASTVCDVTLHSPAAASGSPATSCLAPVAAKDSQDFEPDENLPRSGSSAMPDPTSANVPKLKARVHQRLTTAEYAQITVESLTFRALRQEDISEMVALHTEWFPVSYDEGFYQKSVAGELFSMVASYRHPSSSSSAPPPSDDGDCDEDLLGIITMSTNCEHHGEDITSVLGADCNAICRRGDIEHFHEAGDEPLTAYQDDETCSTTETCSTPQTGVLAYILTLGVVDGFRRKGLAKELLRRLTKHIDEHMVQIQALYLHVVTYNGAAIKLYESANFNRIAEFRNFYLLHGKHYDSYLYALYLHTGRPPWKWRLWQYLGIPVNTTLREWVVGKFSSLWRAEDKELTDGVSFERQAHSREEQSGIEGV